MKSDLVRQTIRDMIAAHHDAFVVELLGAEGSGLSVERIQELVEEGLVDASKLSGWVIPEMQYDIDPFLFTRLMSRVIDSTPPENRHELRDWTLERWRTEVEAVYPQFTTPRGPQTGSVVFGEPERPSVPVNLPEHGIRVTDNAPAWMSPVESRAWKMSRAHAGAYARRLGQRLTDDVAPALEQWDGEEIITEADAELRQEQLEQIREAVGEAIATHGDSERLAVDLMRRTDDWEHNWERIARTELQAAYNDARVLDAMDAYGPETRIARITESGACAQCEALFNSGGVPVVFPLGDILSNGTNVGKRRRDWLPTIYPLHPNCRCDTIVVPPGLIVDSDGRLIKESDA